PLLLAELLGLGFLVYQPLLYPQAASLFPSLLSLFPSFYLSHHGRFPRFSLSLLLSIWPWNRPLFSSTPRFCLSIQRRLVTPCLYIRCSFLAARLLSRPLFQSLVSSLPRCPGAAPCLALVPSIVQRPPR